MLSTFYLWHSAASAFLFKFMDASTFRFLSQAHKGLVDYLLLSALLARSPLLFLQDKQYTHEAFSYPTKKLTLTTYNN